MTPSGDFYISDDVRQAAVTSLAFLLFKNPSQVPQIVQLLSESYNLHVRCGAILALGIACAGTGLQSAVEILEPMTKDSITVQHSPSALPVQGPVCKALSRSWNSLPKTLSTSSVKVHSLPSA